MKQNPLTALLLAVSFLFSAYAAAYFAMVREGDKFGHGPGCMITDPRYVAGSAQFFAPMHCLDRRFLRHHKWDYVPPEFR